VLEGLLMVAFFEFPSVQLGFRCGCHCRVQRWEGLAEEIWSGGVIWFRAG
jgi:hypothetical protein